MKRRCDLKFQLLLLIVAFCIVSLLFNFTRSNDNSSPQRFSRNNADIIEISLRGLANTNKSDTKPFVFDEPIKTKIPVEDVDKIRTFAPSISNPILTAIESIVAVNNTFPPAPQIFSTRNANDKIEALIENNHERINDETSKATQSSIILNETEKGEISESHTVKPTEVVLPVGNALTQNLSTYPVFLFIPILSDSLNSEKISKEETFLEKLYNEEWSLRNPPKNSERKVPNEKTKTSASAFDILKHVHSALRNSDNHRSCLCRTVDYYNDMKFLFSPSSSSSSYSSSSSSIPKELALLQYLVMLIEVDHKTHTFMEYSKFVSGERIKNKQNSVETLPMTYYIAMLYPQLLGILVDLSPVRARSSKCEHVKYSSNVMVVKSHIPSNNKGGKTIVTDVASTTQHVQSGCVQLVSTFESIIASGNNAPLPYEIENHLGHVLCRCDVTLIPKSLPATPLFNYWDSVDILLQESINSIHGLCEITIEQIKVASTGNTTFSPSSSSLSSLSTSSSSTSSYSSKGSSSSSMSSSSTSFVTVVGETYLQIKRKLVGESLSASENDEYHNHTLFTPLKLLT